MFGSSSSRKPYTAITVQIDRLTSEQYEEGDISGIVDLVEVIRIQDSGPTEAARALRKKLKYGNPHRQIRALDILDGLIQNAGGRFQRTFADEPLLERLRVLARDDLVDADVRRKCNTLFRQWAIAYKGTPGLAEIVQLHTQLPKTQKRMQPHQSRIVRENDAEARNESPPGSPFVDPEQPKRPSMGSSPPSSSSRRISLGSTRESSLSSSSLFKRDKKGKLTAFNLEKEKSQMLEAIASASVASNNLANALKLVNRESERVSQNPEVIRRFETCKKIRRNILRYIQLVESEQYIGSLLNANDVLVEALISFEIMDKSTEDDSDSDTEAYTTHRANFQRRAGSRQETEESLAGLHLNQAAPPPRPPPMKPPRPAPVATPPKPIAQYKPPPQEDDDDPFGDQHAS